MKYVDPVPVVIHIDKDFYIFDYKAYRILYMYHAVCQPDPNSDANNGHVASFRSGEKISARAPMCWHCKANPDEAIVKKAKFISMSINT